MEIKKIINKKTISACILFIIAIVSFFCFSKIASDPSFHENSIKILDEKKTTVAELTAATAGSSIAVSMIPGDATSAIANQIANLSSYLLIVVGAIVLEKALLTLTGLLAFKYLIPIACILGIIYIFKPHNSLKNIAIKLTAFSLAVFLVIPISLEISNLIEVTVAKGQVTSEEAIKNSENSSKDFKDEAEKSKDNDKNLVLKWLSSIGEKIKEGTNNTIEKAKKMLSDFIDAIAVLIITSCIIPIVVLFTFIWIIKLIFGVTIETPKIRNRTFYKQNKNEKDLVIN